MRYFASISYNGSGFSGWQIQDNGPSIEEEVEKALSTILGEAVRVTGAGRTDSGVNAMGYIAHFDTCSERIVTEPGTFLYKTNAILPRGIVLNGIAPVDGKSHARFDAVKRTYKYFIHCSKDPFAEAFSWHYKFPVDIARMNEAAQYLIGCRSFSCFEKLHGSSGTSICRVTEAHWDRYVPMLQASPETEHLVFTISADRFLRNMVRAVVGSLLEVGRGKKEPVWIRELLEKGSRSDAGQSVPGNALFFTGIEYPYEIMNIKTK